MNTKNTALRFPEAEKQRAIQKAKSVPTSLTMLTLLGWAEMEKKSNKQILDSLKIYQFDALGRRHVRAKSGKEQCILCKMSKNCTQDSKIIH